MRCAGDLLKLVILSCWWWGNVSGLWPPSTTEEMEHFKTVEIKLLDREPVSVLPPQAQSQAEVHQLLRSWTQHLGHRCSTLETLHTCENIFWWAMTQVWKVKRTSLVLWSFRGSVVLRHRPWWVGLPSSLKYLVGLPLWNSRSTHNSYHTSLSGSLIPKPLFFLGQG